MRPNSYGWRHSGTRSTASLRQKMSEGAINLSLEQLEESGAGMRGRRVGGAGLQAALLLSSQQGLETSSPPLDTTVQAQGAPG